MHWGLSLEIKEVFFENVHSLHFRYLNNELERMHVQALQSFISIIKHYVCASYCQRVYTNILYVKHTQFIFSIWLGAVNEIFSLDRELGAGI